MNSPSVQIVNNLIANNVSASNGGGIYCENSHLNLINNTIRENYCGEFFLGGGGLHCANNSTLNIVNTIFWENNVNFGSSREIFVGGGGSPCRVNIHHSDVKGGKVTPYVYCESGAVLNWGFGMIKKNPLFVSNDPDDAHLTYTSPCKDSGDNTIVTELFDFEGDQRIVDGTVDMGADEFATHLYHIGNPTPGGNINLIFVGVPNTTPVILWLGSGVMDPPMGLPPYGDWHLQFPILMEANFSAIPGPSGVLIFSANIPANLPTPLDLPLQAAIGLKLSNLCEIKIQ